MRPSRDEWAINMAKLNACQTTCFRRAVGCVLLNARGHILSTGYNGVASGVPHCNHFDLTTGKFPNKCLGAESPSGTNLDGCASIHAEMNALLQCKDVYNIDTCYVTTSPCVTCTKLLLNTSCKRIVFVEQYSHLESKDLWLSAERIWTQFPQ